MRQLFRELAPEVDSEALVQHARELAPEASEEEFLEAFGFGICARCGRRGLDDEDFTDCDLSNDPETPWDLLCHECLRASESSQS